MTDLDPQPGDWVLIRAKVLARPFPETVLVELFSKTDQYEAHVRPDLVVEIVPKPIPDEPATGSVALVNDEAFQRQVTGGWIGVGHPRIFSWATLAGGSSEVEVIHHA
ncbi:hypothetical protein ACWKSP_26400 [Micromonosporaceae bacterium Da 78-11]